MGRFLKRLIKTVDKNEYIDPNKWNKIIEEADEETLTFLQEEGFETIKYFTRDDWMDTRTTLDLKDKVNSRLNDLKTDEWFNKHF